jgi:hypothetical protein
MRYDERPIGKLRNGIEEATLHLGPRLAAGRCLVVAREPFVSLGRSLAIPPAAFPQAWIERRRSKPEFVCDDPGGVCGASQIARHHLTDPEAGKVVGDLRGLALAC